MKIWRANAKLDQIGKKLNKKIMTEITLKTATLYEAKYSRVDQVRFMDDSL